MFYKYLILNLLLWKMSQNRLPLQEDLLERKKLEKKEIIPLSI